LVQTSIEDAELTKEQIMEVDFDQVDKKK